METLQNIFDSHAHYDDSQFDSDRNEVLASLPEKGVCGIVNCASDIPSAKASVALAEKYAFLWAAAGIHPHEAAKASEEDFDELNDLIRHQRVVAVGEIGLDYHYDFSPRDIQLACFERQLSFAKENRLPVIVHDREAHDDTLRLLRKYRPFGVVHCFSGSPEMAREIIALGMFIGIGGAVTFKNARKAVEVAETIPFDRLLLETDAPYMAPIPFRGKRCTSDLILHTANRIAEIRNLSVSAVLERTKSNAAELFCVN